MMDKYLSQVPEPYTENLYIPLIDKSIDRPLWEYILEVCKSFDGIPGMHFVGYEYNDKESTIEINKYLPRRGRPTSSTKKPPKSIRKIQKGGIKEIDDTRVGLLTIFVDVVAKTKTGETVRKTFEKSIFIPKEDRNGLLYSRGNYYNIIWQLYEKSTYRFGAELVFKSNIRIAVYYEKYAITDVIGNTYSTPIYKVDVRKEKQFIMLMFAVWNNGLIGALTYLGLAGCVDIITDEEVDLDDEDYLYFKISSTCYIRVIKEMFDKYDYIKSVVSGSFAISNNRTRYETCMSDKAYLIILGGGKLENGINYRQSFFRGIDVTVRKESLLPECNKRDIYTILRWMCENYQSLRQKENSDYANKRVRRNGQISSIFTETITRRAMKLMTAKEREMEEYKNFFNFPSNILINTLTNSQLIRYDNCINDMTFFSNFKFTIKGHQSSGNSNRKRISTEIVANNLSHIGRKDLTTASNSDPGATGLLSPFNKLDGVYFDSTPDPDNFQLDFSEDMRQYMEKRGKFYISPRAFTEEEYHEIKNRLLSLMDSTEMDGTLRDYIEPVYEGIEKLDKGSDV